MLDDDWSSGCEFDEASGPYSNEDIDPTHWPSRNLLALYFLSLTPNIICFSPTSSKFEFGLGFLKFL